VFLVSTPRLKASDNRDLHDVGRGLCPGLRLNVTRNTTTGPLIAVRNRIPSAQETDRSLTSSCSSGPNEA
jgi:hypothetical protein